MFSSRFAGFLFITFIAVSGWAANLASADNTRDPLLQQTGWIYWPTLDTSIFYQTRQNSFANSHLLAPFWQNQNSLTYFNADGNYVENGRFSGALGLGWRHVSASREWLYGLYANYDRLTGVNNENWFSQVIIGARVQTEHWIYEANGYMPVLNTTQTSAFQAPIAFQNTVAQHGFETLLPGADAQFGYRFSDLAGLGMYLGGYYFHRDGFQTVAGPEASIHWDLENPFDLSGPLADACRELGLSTGIYYDKQNDFAWYIGLRWMIGSGHAEQTGLERQMTAVDYRLFN